MTRRSCELRGVTKSYGEHQVLRGIDLAVGEHEAIALIGASGSGKSTLLRCIDLLEEIDDGDIFLDGEPITVPGLNPVPIRRRLGLVFQAFNLFPHMRVIDNVTLGARPRPEDAAPTRHASGAGDARALRPRRPRRATTPTGSPAASSSASRSRGRCSPGRARCCSTRSRSRSTPSSSARCSTVIRELKQEGMTMLIATHEMSFARDVADQVCFLQDGRIVERGEPEQIFTDPSHADTQRFLARLLEANRL